ncbi:hypothetical protein NPIL_385421 [Nephila pilipes]|uniref:Uncharacterized protein n=1 Tax=Nephila pilipes TaxID=299642 RepID=A0A8X6UIR4_NEPPI|nr:hypothetical protein NPIL_385421 [Nephila pilipes]
MAEKGHGANIQALWTEFIKSDLYKKGPDHESDLPPMQTIVHRVKKEDGEKKWEGCVGDKDHQHILPIFLGPSSDQRWQGVLQNIVNHESGLS